MLKIRLKRAGSKGRPFYRVVVIDSREKRDGRSVEDLGYYNPLTDPVAFTVDRERVSHWTERGAQLTDSVASLLRRENTGLQTERNTEAFTVETAEDRKARRIEREKVKEEPAAAVAVAEAPEAEAAPETEAPAADAAAEAATGDEKTEG